MELSDCIRDYIKACNNDNVGMKSAYLCYFMIIPYILTFLLLFMNT